MTVGELKKALEDIDDDIDVWLSVSHYDVKLTDGELMDDRDLGIILELS